jgi:hypothetical protein
LHSSVTFLSHARPGLAYSSIPPPCDDLSDYSNLVKKETCFTKNASPTLIDVILTNKPSHCQNTTNFNWGLSAMGYVYLQLQDKIFQKFHMQSLYLIHFLYLQNIFLDLQHTFHNQSF